MPRCTLVLLLLGGCIDGGVVRSMGERIAVTQGDFDDVAAPFNRLGVPHDAYEGLISVATWDDSFDPADNSLKVEVLFGQDTGRFDTIFVASGTRGLGAQQYNGLEPDDAFVSDPFVIDAVRNFVARGGNLVVTDWAYDLVEAAWPDAIDFLGDDTVWDAAQAGEITVTSATVPGGRPTRELRNQLGGDSVAVAFDFSGWTVIDDVAEDVTVWERADTAFYQVGGDEGLVQIEDVPVLVSFAPDGADMGHVVFFAYHLDAQTEDVIDGTIRAVVGEFEGETESPLTPIE